MDITRLAIRQPVTVAVGVILIVLAGIVALSRLPIALTPTVEDTIIAVTTFWEGATPQEIEENIIDKQEERLSSLTGLRLMTSSSMQGQGRIRLEFFTGVDKDDALREVNQKLREVPDYPENVDEPVIEASDPENRDYIAWIVFGTTDPDFDIRTLRDFAVDRIEPELERVEGIEEINVLGGRERELQIRIDPWALAQFGITPTEFRNVIVQTNRNASAGQLAQGKLDVRVRTIGQYQSVEDILNTVIASDDEGGEVYVRDVADAVVTYKEPSSFVRSSGNPVIAINAEREIGSNIIAVMESLQDALADMNAPNGLLDAEARRLGLSGKLTLRQVYDQTIYIDDALALVRNNIWLGGALATIVLILFLRSVRSVGIIALAIPISVIGAVVAMVAMGRSINVISLAGMAFAVGMVVDNAIVVLENIYRHLEMGKTPRLAAYDGGREVWGAVLASTLTTIAVFIPILLIESEAGQLFRDIALAICAAVALSLLVSITLIPTASARFLRAFKPKERKPRRKLRKKSKKTPEPAAQSAEQNNVPRHGISVAIGRVIYWLSGGYVVRFVLIAVMVTVAVVGTFLMMPPTDYLPTGNRNLVLGLIIPPPGYNIEQREAMALRIEETMRPFWEAHDKLGDEDAYEKAVEQLPQVPTVNPATYQPGPPVTPPSLENYFLVSFEDILFHGAVSDDPKRVVDVVALMNHAARPEVIPGTFAFAFQTPLFQLGGSTGSAVKMQLAGRDLDRIVPAAMQLFGRLNSVDMFGQIQPSPSNFYLEAPEIAITRDDLRLGEAGLQRSDIDLLVRMAGDGAIVDEYQFGGERIDLKIIQASSVEQEYITGLDDLPLAADDGTIVMLGSVADVTRTSAPQEIARVGRQRAVSFEVTPSEGVPLGEAVAELQRITDDLRDQGVIPPGISTSMAGSAGKLQEVQEALLGDGSFAGLLGSSLVLALIVVYLLMCVLFQSFTMPLVIMFSVPLATLGGFLGLFIVHTWSVADRYMPQQTLDVLTMLGFILLIGVVVNNAILIVHQTLNFLRGEADVRISKDVEMTPRRAIAEAVRTRVRPIFMSTLTSVGGMLPLVLMPGSGSELYRGLGSVVVGGLLLSTVFTLLLVPLLLSVAFDVLKLIGASTPSEADIKPVTA